MCRSGGSANRAAATNCAFAAATSPALHRQRRQAPPAPRPRRPGRTAAGRQQPSFRAGIDIVSLNVTVTDAANHYVTDLAEGDFSVFEDGVKQNITFFSRRQQPIAMSLLLDSSASMEQHLGTLQTAATNFIKKLKSNDLAQVIDFDSRVEIRQGFTGNQGELEAAIQQTNAGGSTSLHNAIYIALKELRKVKAVSEEDVRRQALIVFSGRRGHVQPGLVRGSARSGKALRNSDLCHRAARQRRPGQGLPRGGVRHADAGPGDRRPSFFPPASRI